MKAHHKCLIRKQLEKTTTRIACIRNISRPAKGWLRAVREALGMSSKQFAHRLGVSPPRVTALEQSEQNGAVTIKTMQRAAESLDSIFVYAIIPRESFSATIHGRAESLVHKRMNQVNHSMLLENQQLSANELQDSYNAEVEKVIREMPTELWEDNDGI